MLHLHVDAVVVAVVLTAARAYVQTIKGCPCYFCTHMLGMLLKMLYLMMHK